MTDYHSHDCLAEMFKLPFFRLMINHNYHGILSGRIKQTNQNLTTQVAIEEHTEFQRK